MWLHGSLDILPQGRASYYNYGWTPPDDNAKDPRHEKNIFALSSIYKARCLPRLPPCTQDGAGSPGWLGADSERR